MKTKILSVIAALILSSCGSGGGGGATQARDLVPAQPEQPIVPPQNPNVSVTVFKLQKTEAPVNGWVTKTYTASGSCFIYSGKTYCFDDGVKTLQWTQNNVTYGPYTYTYWSRNASLGHCHGGCDSDYFTTPKEMTNNVVTAVGNQNINAVFNQGQSSALSCEDNGQTLNCGQFLINL